MATITGQSYFGPLSSFVPKVQADLLVMFARNPKAFAYQRYAQIQPVDTMRFYYPVLGNVDVIRNFNQAEDVWIDGQMNPAWNAKAETESLSFAEATTVRYSEHDTFGYLTVSQAQNANLDILGIRSFQLSSKATMKRTARIVNVLTTAANWGTYTGTMTAFAGGQISAATSTNPYIRIMFTKAVETIIQNTGGAADQNDIMAVMNVDTARQIFQSQEIIDFVKQQPDVYKIITGEGNWNKRYWLPPELYGVEIQIEDAVQTTTAQGLASSPGYVWPNADIAFMTKKKGIATNESSPVHTFALFTFQDFAIELQDEVIHKRYLLNVLNNTAEILVAPQAGFFVSACY